MENFPKIPYRIISVAGFVSFMTFVCITFYYESHVIMSYFNITGKAIFFSIVILLAAIHICDMVSAFSNRFSNSLKALERKYVFIPIFEIVFLSLTYLLIMGVTVILSFVGLFSGDDYMFFFVPLLCIVSIFDMIIIIVAKGKVIGSRKNNNNPYNAVYPPQYYNQQNPGNFNMYPQQGFNPNYPPQNNGFNSQVNPMNNYYQEPDVIRSYPNQPVDNSNRGDGSVF